MESDPQRQLTLVEEPSHTGHARQKLRKEPGIGACAEKPLEQHEPVLLASPPESTARHGSVNDAFVLDVLAGYLTAIEDVFPLPLAPNENTAPNPLPSGHPATASPASVNGRSPHSTLGDLELPTRPDTPEEEEDGGDFECGPGMTQSLSDLRSPDSEPSTLTRRASSLGLVFNPTPAKVDPVEIQELPAPEPIASLVRVRVKHQWTWEGGDLGRMRRTYEGRGHDDERDGAGTTSNGEDAALPVQSNAESENLPSTTRPNRVWLALPRGKAISRKQYMADRASKKRVAKRKAAKAAKEEGRRGER